MTSILYNVESAKLEYQDKHIDYGGNINTQDAFADALANKDGVLILAQGENHALFGALTTVPIYFAKQSF